jgi:recA bacterial DNA recombination protein
MNAAYLLGVVGTPSLFSSGSPGLDALLYGGVWRGAVHVLSGDSSSGKSLLALLLCRAVQRAGGQVLYCDTEGGFSQDFASRLGLSPRGFHAVRARVGEAAFALCEKVAKQGAADLIVLDSIHGITAREELDAPKLHTGQKARDRLVSLGSQRLARAAKQGKAAVVIIHRYALSESVARCAPARFARIWLDVQRSSLQWDTGRVIEARCWVKSQRGGAPPRCLRGVLFTDEATPRTEHTKGESEMLQDGTIYEESSHREQGEPNHPERGLHTPTTREEARHRRSAERSPATPQDIPLAAQATAGEKLARDEVRSEPNESPREANPVTEKAHATRAGEETPAPPIDAHSSAVDAGSTRFDLAAEPPRGAHSSTAGAAPRAAGAAQP